MDLSGLLAVAGLFMAVVMAIFIFTFIQNLIMELAGHRIMHDLRLTLYQHIQNMPLRFFTRNPVARLVTRVTNDIQNMHDLFTSFISMVFKDIFLRPFGSDKTRYLWVALVFFCPPTILIYLPLHGFKPRRANL